MQRPDAPAALTHGRHCSCSACAREDWTKITAPCGMHGASCPAVYAPVAAKLLGPEPVWNGRLVTVPIRRVLGLYIAGVVLGLAGGFFTATAVWGWTELVH